MGIVGDKNNSCGHSGRSMESHMIETALLVLDFFFLCLAVVAVQAIISVSHLSLELQEQVAVQDTPIVTRVKFGKCHRKSKK